MTDSNVQRQYLKRRRQQRASPSEADGCGRLLIDGLAGSVFGAAFAMWRDPGSAPVWVILIAGGVLGIPVGAGVGVLVRRGWATLRSIFRNL